MVHQPVSSGHPLPVPPPVDLIPPLLATPPAKVQNARIEGYDLARAFAVIGMTVVNYYGIFRDSYKADLPFTPLASFLSGRAAALFVMLAGIGLTLLASKPMLSNSEEAWLRFRGQIARRSMILFFMGILFSLIWYSDILHFYSLFLLAGTFCLQLSMRRLWLTIAVIWLVAAAIFTVSLGDPNLDFLSFLPNYFYQFFDEFFISGQYAFFPWFCFLLVGIWFGRSAMRGSSRFQTSLFLGASMVFCCCEVIMAQGPSWLHLPLDQDLPSLSLLENNPFPPSPFFTLSACSSALMALCAAIMLCRQPFFGWFTHSLKDIGRMSLTIYIGHIIIGKALAHVFKTTFDAATYPSAVTLFMILIMLGQWSFAVFWCRYFQYGPLEWLLRKCATATLPVKRFTPFADRPE